MKESSIDANLVQVRAFLSRVYEVIGPEVLKLTSPSELEASIFSVCNEEFDFENKELTIRLDYRKLKKLSSKEKLFIYILLRLLSLDRPDNFKTSFFLFDEYLEKINFLENDEYFYYKHITDNQFLYIFDVKLDKKHCFNNTCRILYSKLGNTIQGKYSLESIFLQFLLPRPFVTLKTKPKRLIRHKGYRDHGSLGTELSRTLKDQSSDYTFREREEELERERQEIESFLEGSSY